MERLIILLGIIWFIAALWGVMKMSVNIEYYKQMKYLGGDSLFGQWLFIWVITWFIMTAIAGVLAGIWLYFFNLVVN